MKKKVSKSTTTKKTKKTVKKANKKPTTKAKKKVVKKKSPSSKNKPKIKKIVTKKKDKWANITITESGEIIEKKPKTENKKSKEVIQQSPDASTGKKEEGIYDEGGFWNGSTMSDQQIASIKDERERFLAEQLDKAQEEVRRAREDRDDPDYIATCVREVARLREELNQINNNKYMR